MPKKPKKTNPPAVQEAGEDALGKVLEKLSGEGLDKLQAAIQRGNLSLTNASVRRPRPCKGCPPDLPEPVLKLPPGAQRVYVAILAATDGYLGTKEIIKSTKIAARSVGRHLNLLREAHLIHYVPGRGYRKGAGPNLFSATS